MGAAKLIRRAVTLAAVALAALLAGCAAAPGRLLLHDETGALTRAQVEAAAAPLLARGARVAVIVAARGDDTGGDLTRRLDAAGLIAGGLIAPDALALYISYEPRYSELRAGARWSERLPAAALREIRGAALNPALRGDAPAAGVAATLGALEARLASPPLAQRVAGALGAVVTAGIALAVLARSPPGRWLGRWWRSSPPGRLARWLGDQTPGGRRRLERVIRTTRLRMEDRAAYARSWCRAASGTRRAEAAPLLERLRALDQERAALAAGARRGRALEQAMDKLAWDYQALGVEAERLAPAQAPPMARRGQRAADIGSPGAGAAAAGAGGAGSSPAGDSPSWETASSGDSGPSGDGGPW